MTSLPNQSELQTLFSGFLFESGLSAVSVKNYLSDLRHFFSFCATISSQDNPPTVQEIFQSISKYLNIYLIDQKKSFTPQNTTNRRLASIRRFSTFLELKFGLVSSLQEPVQSSKVTNSTQNLLKNDEDDSLPTISKILGHFRSFLLKEKKSHSTIKNYISDLNHFFAWSANETPFLDQNLENILSESHLNTYVTYLKLSHTSTSVINRRQSSIKQFTKYCFLQKYIPSNPFEYKHDAPRLLPLAWLDRLSGKNNAHKKAPKTKLGLLYQKYNSLPFVPYLHLAILVLATSAMVIFGYTQIVKQARPSSAALPTVPRRQLSFQGRLTDSSGTPITTAVNVTFKLWNDPTAGTQLYTSNACSITPDPNGIFNTLIGNGTCGQEIANTVFSENRDVYLEVIVGLETLTPRQQIATVGYALNSETLQGYPASATATINTVPIVDDNGDINIAVTSPTINSTSGTFTLNGQAVTISTTSNSGGDIVLQPDAIGGGQILALGGTTDTDFFRIENANLTSGALISGYVGNDTATGRLLSLTAGSTETDRFYVAANGQTMVNTSATLVNAGLIINQNGTGDLFTASASGDTKFTIRNNGDVNITGQYLVNNTPLMSSNWQRTDGSLSPLHITDSINLGSTATGSALTHFAGTANENSWFNTGSLGVGTNSPAEKLDVNGGIRLAMTTNSNAGTLRYTTSNNLELFDGTYWSILNTGKLTKEITGFVDRSTTTIAFNDATPDRTFTITGTNFPVYIKSQEFLKNTETIQISTTIGLHYIYYNAAGTLTEGTNAWNLATEVPIATVYWNGTTGLLGDERHGITMDNSTHEYLHKTVGTRYDTGLGGSFTNTTFSIDPGSIYDEDLKISITPAQTTTRVFYRVPAATSFTYTAPQTAYYTASTGVLDYDNAGTRTAVPSNSYVAYWVFATNDPSTPIYTLMGQRVDGNLTNARNNNNYQSLSLATLPFAEMKLLYRVIVRNQGGTATYIETQDQRNITNLPSGTYIATAHGTLTGLLNDDHTQYALLAGRSLGQTLIGGDAANEILTFQGNAGATGNTATNANLVFKVGDAGVTTAMTILNNGNIGIGVTNPSYKLDVSGDLNITGSYLVNGAALTASNWQRINGSLAPLNTSDSINIGSSATGSALIHFGGTANENSFFNNGNLGLGTTTPAAKLDVVGNINISGYATFSASIAVGYNNAPEGFGNAIFQNYVGIGLSNPAYNLDITGNMNITGGFRASNSFGNSGQVLSSTGSGVQWVDAAIAAGNTSPWDWNTGVIYPFSITDAVNLGSNATASATVHLAGTAGDNSFINTGKFGIGTNNPSNLLEVYGLGSNIQSSIENANTTSSEPGIVLTKTLTAGTAGDGMGSTILFQAESGNSNFPGIKNTAQIISMISWQGDVSNGPKGDLVFQTGWNGSLQDRMRLDADGNLGIGISNPSYTLDISGDINLTGALYDNGSAGTAGQILSTTGTGVQWIDAPTGTGGESLWQWNGGVLSPLDLNDSINLGNAATSSATVHLAGKANENSFINTGNFGIGDTTPTAALTVGNGDVFQVNSSGAIAAATGITSSGNVSFSSLTASRAVFTDGSNNLTTTATSQYILDSISDETGTGTLVFNTSPTFATDITTPLIIGGTADSSSLQLKSTSGVGTTDFISLNVGNNGGTEALRAISNGYVGIGTTTPSQLLQVGSGTGFLVNNDGAIMNANGATISGSVRLSSLGAGIIHSDINGYLSSSALNLTSDVTGILPLANGGTNNDNIISPYVSGKFIAYDGTRLVSTAFDADSFQTALTFTNGLTKTLDVVTLGGALTANTNIDMDIHSMTFTGAGNFGIGAAAPSQKLDVAGFFVVDTVNSRVGIGTTTPTARVEIAGSTSTISNTNGDITINSASDLLNFSGDSLTNFLNATASGQIKLASFSDDGRPESIGMGSIIYSTTQQNPIFYDGTEWKNFFSYFDRTAEGVMYPSKQWYDSINLFAATGDGATSSAKIRLSGDIINNSFFMSPTAFGFNTSIDQPRGGYTFAIQTSGGILPKADATDRLGYTGYQWKELYLSNDIIKGTTAVVTLSNYSLTGAVWHADQGFKVGDTNGLSSGLKFEVTGNASVSGTLNTGGTITVAGGVGKIYAGAVDPPYTINGTRYATYMASMVGMKEETAGKVTTSSENYIEGIGFRTLIDLDQQPVGSDIWLFSKTTDIQKHINDLSVLLTPEGQAKAWYEIDSTNKILAIYSSTPTNITYRLTAPRFDSEEWKNTRTEGGNGYVLNDYNIYSNTNSIFNNPVLSPELIAKLDNSGQYLLKVNDVENKEVSSFMTSIIANLRVGVATIANLVVDNLTIRTKLISPIADIDQLKAIDATISGTLYANNIKGQAIDSLNAQINLLNEKYSTASAILADIQVRYSSYDSLIEATSGAIFSNDPLQLSPLATTSAIIPTDLAYNSLNVETLMANDILANGSIFTKAISAFDTDLFIQPAGDQPVHILANLMTLYPNGKILVNGDLIINGTLYAQTIDTQIATVSGTLAVGSSSISTESARFAQLKTDGLVIASGTDSMATISGQTNSNATIGVATMVAGSTEISILNTKVTPSTLIYITPTSDTAGRVLYVKSKTEGLGFTVGITGDEYTPTTSFNYWLVETK